MKSNNSEAMETRFLGRISAASIRNLLPRSASLNKKLSFNPKIPKSNSENTPPVDPNIQINDEDITVSVTKQSLRNLQGDAVQSIDPVDASSAPEPPLKDEVSQSDSQNEASVASDPPVKVVVRIRPSVNERDDDRIVKKVASDTLSVGDRKFSFDSVFDSNSKQEDIFQLVGAPLVKDALAGYNISILSYGQTGSGKTYTMWGPPSAMVEELSAGSNQGIVPRIFYMLFSEIEKEQQNAGGKQINYQCRCSFLEIYNEQIGDLLDPTQRNLEIKDDPKNGLYVENLTEEYVANYEDVTQILIKGLSSRKVGATTSNSKSSRSHVVFSFIIESWCKETSSACFGSSRTSRISVVDLAGLDRNIVDDAGKQCTIEAKNVKKSLSRLGNLVNTLAEGTQPEECEDALYKSSCLTHLLRDSFGGNAKLTVICAISRDKKCSGETLRTLRFGQRLKFMKNEPVINEITEDDVNDLSDQIRQLKEELIKAKSNVNSNGNLKGYFQGRNVRESLNQLRVSLNRSLILPQICTDSDEELDFKEEDVKDLHQELDKLHFCHEENYENSSGKRDSVAFSSVGESFETDSMSEGEVNRPELTEIGEANEESHNEVPKEENKIEDQPISAPDISGNIEISSCNRSPILEDPPMSESPKFSKSQRKSVSISSNLSVSHKESSRQSLNQSEHFRSSLRSSKVFQGPTESLAASLQRGLKIIDHHQKNLALNRSSVSFSFEHLALQPSPEVDKTSASLPELKEEEAVDGGSSTFLCASCQRRVHGDNANGSKTWIVSVNEAGIPNSQTPKGQQSKDENPVEHDQETLRLEPAKDVDEQCEIKEVQEELGHEHGGSRFFDAEEKEALLKEIQTLRSKLQSLTEVSASKSTDKLRSSLLARSIQLRKSSINLRDFSEEELDSERQRWTEMESEWICLTDELRIDLEAQRKRAEAVEMELKSEKNCTEELNDALQRAVLGHARMVEHYAELQEKYNDLAGRYRAIMEGIAEFKRAAAKAGSKGHGSRFAKSLATELSALRVEREREREMLKKENKSLRIQLRDTAEAVHAAGELLVRLREAEHAASAAEDNHSKAQQENEKLKKQMEKLKRKHKMEMVTMKQYLAESRLPASALQPMYHEEEDSDMTQYNGSSPFAEDDQAWKAEFGAIYQDHHY